MAEFGQDWGQLGQTRNFFVRRSIPVAASYPTRLRSRYRCFPSSTNSRR